MNDQKIVDFKYCNSCKHSDTYEGDDPCNECLNHPTNTYSHRPVNYEEIENERIKKRNFL